MNTTYNLDFKADRLPQRGVKKCESPVNDFSHLKYVFLHSVRHLTRRLEFAAMAATPLAHRPQARVGLDSSASFLRVAACYTPTGWTLRGRRSELSGLARARPLLLAPLSPSLKPGRSSADGFGNGTSVGVYRCLLSPRKLAHSVLGSVVSPGPDALSPLVSFKVCAASSMIWGSLRPFKTQICSLRK